MCLTISHSFINLKEMTILVEKILGITFKFLALSFVCGHNLWKKMFRFCVITKHDPSKQLFVEFTILSRRCLRSPLHANHKVSESLMENGVYDYLTQGQCYSKIAVSDSVILPHKVVTGSDWIHVDALDQFWQNSLVFTLPLRKSLYHLNTTY